MYFPLLFLKFHLFQHKICSEKYFPIFDATKNTSLQKIFLGQLKIASRIYTATPPCFHSSLLRTATTTPFSFLTPLYLHHQVPFPRFYMLPSPPLSPFPYSYITATTSLPPYSSILLPIPPLPPPLPTLHIATAWDLQSIIPNFYGLQLQFVVFSTNRLRCYWFL